MSGVLLLLTAAAKLYSATGTAEAIAMMDPLLHVSYRNVMIGAGLLEAAIALYLILGRNVTRQAWLIFWLSSNFIIYRTAHQYLQINICPCLGMLTEKIPFSRTQVNSFLALLTFALFFGSGLILIHAWNRLSGHSISQPFEEDGPNRSQVSAGVADLDVT